jgi:hypothetical protein
MFSEWIMGEHHRLHIVEEWPDGPYKEAVLAAETVRVGSPFAGFSRRSTTRCVLSAITAAEHNPTLPAF